MSKIDNLIKKFNNNPTSCSYTDIEKILIHFKFKKIYTKGNHVKFKHYELSHDLIIPIHNNECKDFYKNQAKKQIDELINKKF